MVCRPIPALSDKATPRESAAGCCVPDLTAQPLRRGRMSTAPSGRPMSCAFEETHHLVDHLGSEAFVLAYRPAAPSPTTTNGAQKAGCASSLEPLSMNASMERRIASARPTVVSRDISRTAPVISLTVASE